MCIAAGKSKMSNTLIYSGLGVRDGKEVHVLAYQNRAITNQPNAMIIPFPTDVKMTQDNIINTTKFPNILKDIAETSRIKTLSATKGIRRSVSRSAANVFNVGSYTVILADHCSQIPEALERVPLGKRPEISTRFLIGLNKLYPEQPVAVCCWNGDIQAEPLLWWYEAKNKQKLFFPTMDSHDGEAPRLNDLVVTDHIISIGSSNKDHKFGSVVFYKDEIPADVQDLLPFRVNGTRLPEDMVNGDVFVYTTQDTAKNSFKAVWRRGHDGVYADTKNFINKGYFEGWS